MMGYDGYYSEIRDYYSFSFEKDSKIITVNTSDYSLLSGIEVVESK